MFDQYFKGTDYDISNCRFYKKREEIAKIFKKYEIEISNVFVGTKSTLKIHGPLSFANLVFFIDNIDENRILKIRDKLTFDLKRIFQKDCNSFWCSKDNYNPRIGIFKEPVLQTQFTSFICENQCSKIEILFEKGKKDFFNRKKIIMPAVGQIYKNKEVLKALFCIEKSPKKSFDFQFDKQTLNAIYILSRIDDFIERGVAPSKTLAAAIENKFVPMIRACQVWDPKFMSKHMLKQYLKFESLKDIVLYRTDYLGQTILHYAIFRENREIIRPLLYALYDLEKTNKLKHNITSVKCYINNIRDIRGKSCMDIAKIWRFDETFVYMVEKAKYNFEK